MLGIGTGHRDSGQTSRTGEAALIGKKNVGITRLPNPFRAPKPLPILTSSKLEKK